MLTREKLLYLIQNHANGDWRNISFIATTNSHPIFFKYYNSPGKGVKFIDEDMGDGNYITGFLFWERVAPASITDDRVTEKHEIFIEIELIDRIGFKRDTPPPYANPEEDEGEEDGGG